jgi:hypothetical protein
VILLVALAVSARLAEPENAMPLGSDAQLDELADAHQHRDDNDEPVSSRCGNDGEHHRGASVAPAPCGASADVS